MLGAISVRAIGRLPTDGSLRNSKTVRGGYEPIYSDVACQSSMKKTYVDPDGARLAG